MLVYCGHETDMAGNTARVVHHGIGLAGDPETRHHGDDPRPDRPAARRAALREQPESSCGDVYAAYAENRVAERPSIAAFSAERQPASHRDRQGSPLVSDTAGGCRGAGWLYGYRWLERLLDFVSIVVLARILAPDDFGLVAIAPSFVTIIEGLSAFDVNKALIRAPRRESLALRQRVDAVRAPGLATALIMVAIAPFVTDARISASARRPGPEPAADWSRQPAVRHVRARPGLFQARDPHARGRSRLLRGHPGARVALPQLLVAGHRSARRRL